MGIGYILGCLLSIVTWKIEREKIFCKLDKIISKIFKVKILIQLIYALIVAFIFFIYKSVGSNEYMNFLTGFLVIDLSNKEMHNLNLYLNDKIKFYESLSLLTEGILCGFLAPLFYITIFKSNFFGVAYFIVYMLYKVEDYKVIDIIFNVLTIIPSLILQPVFYIIYVFRSKTFKVDFKGDFFRNTLKRPLLNLDILGAYMEEVNFYYYFQENNTSFIKSYGNYTSRIDENCIKDYLSIIYGIAFATFIVFEMLIIL